MEPLKEEDKETLYAMMKMKLDFDECLRNYNKDGNVASTIEQINEIQKRLADVKQKLEVLNNLNSKTYNIVENMVVKTESDMPNRNNDLELPQNELNAKLTAEVGEKRKNIQERSEEKDEGRKRGKRGGKKLKERNKIYGPSARARWNYIISTYHSKQV